MSEPMTTSQTMFMIISIVVGFVVWFVLLFSGVIFLCRWLSRWPQLVARYPFQEPTEGFRTHYQTMSIGPVRFKRCVSIFLSPQGLGLRIAFPGFAPVTIPWSEFTAAVPASLFWLGAVRLSIGNPPLTTMTITRALYNETVNYAGPNALPTP